MPPAPRAGGPERSADAPAACAVGMVRGTVAFAVAIVMVWNVAAAAAAPRCPPMRVSSISMNLRRLPAMTGLFGWGGKRNLP